jgi:hypothetical protein
MGTAESIYGGTPSVVPVIALIGAKARAICPAILLAQVNERCAMHMQLINMCSASKPQVESSGPVRVRSFRAWGELSLVRDGRRIYD